jgi:hypothetical protein
MEEQTLHVVIIASGEAYQEAAARAAGTYARCAGAARVSVLLPEGEKVLESLESAAKSGEFQLEWFPLRLVSDKKFTSQLKCQGYWHALSLVKEEELLLLADADTCCFRKIELPEKARCAIMAGSIGLVADIADRHSQSAEEPWYLSAEERLTYVNSGIIFASKKAVGLFQRFRELSEQPDFLRGPFNDQKVINFALARHFRERLVVLRREYNQILQPFRPETIIGHFAGGAGYLGVQSRKNGHLNSCLEVLGSGKGGSANVSACL